MKPLFAALGLALLTIPTHAADTDGTRAEIAAMREEITALRSNLMSLNLKLADMQTMMRDMNTTLLKMRNDALEAKKASDSAAAQGCMERLNALKAKRDKLITLGYRPEHPDLRAVGARIDKLEVECAAEAKAGQ